MTPDESTLFILIYVGWGPLHKVRNPHKPGTPPHINIQGFIHLGGNIIYFISSSPVSGVKQELMIRSCLLGILILSSAFGIIVKFRIREADRERLEDFGRLRSFSPMFHFHDWKEGFALKAVDIFGGQRFEHI